MCAGGICGAVTEPEADEPECALRTVAAAVRQGWLTTPFMLDLTLRRGLPAAWRQTVTSRFR